MRFGLTGSPPTKALLGVSQTGRVQTPLHVDSTTAAAAETVPGVTTKASRSRRYLVLLSLINPANAGPWRFSASWAHTDFRAQQRGNFCLCTRTLGAWAPDRMAQVVLQQAGVVSPISALLKFF